MVNKLKYRLIEKENPLVDFNDFCKKDNWKVLGVHWLRSYIDGTCYAPNKKKKRMGRISVGLPDVCFDDKEGLTEFLNGKAKVRPVLVFIEKKGKKD